MNPFFRSVPLFALFLLTTLRGSVLAGNPGTTALNFLKLEVGARQAGMAGGGVALADDVNAVRSNPAAIAFLRKFEAAALYTRYLQGIQYEHVGLAVPTRFGSFGLQATALDYGDIPSYDANDTPIGSVSANDLGVGLSYGRTFFHSLSLGVTGRYLHERLDFMSVSSYSGDVGLVYLPYVQRGFWSHVGFAFAIQNVGPRVRFIQQEANLPTQWVVGLSFDALDADFNTYSEVRKPIDNDIGFAAGIEYWFIKRFALRGGYQSNVDAGSGATLGMGIREHGLELNYGWKPFGDLGNSHFISLLYRWGDEPRRRRNWIISPRQPLPKASDEMDPDREDLMKHLSEPIKETEYKLFKDELKQNPHSK